MDLTFFIYTFWILVSIVIGVSDAIAVSELWKVRNSDGALYELMYKSSNAIYKIVFALILLIARLHTPLPLIYLTAIWTILFLINGVSSALFALYIKGKINEDFLRKYLKK